MSFSCRREAFQLFCEFKYTLSKRFPMVPRIFGLCLTLCPWEQLSQSISTMARYQGGHLQMPAGKLLQLSPEQPHQPRTSFHPPTKTWRAGTDQTPSAWSVTGLRTGFGACWGGPRVTVQPAWWRRDWETLFLFQLQKILFLWINHIYALRKSMRKSVCYCGTMKRSNGNGSRWCNGLKSWGTRQWGASRHIYIGHIFISEESVPLKGSATLVVLGMLT